MGEAAILLSTVELQEEVGNPSTTLSVSRLLLLWHHQPMPHRMHMGTVLPRLIISHLQDIWQMGFMGLADMEHLLFIRRPILPPFTNPQVI
jgi:hypothetical protein